MKKLLLAVAAATLMTSGFAAGYDVPRELGSVDGGEAGLLWRIVGQGQPYGTAAAKVLCLNGETLTCTYTLGRKTLGRLTGERARPTWDVIGSESDEATAIVRCSNGATVGCTFFEDTSSN